jgi:hypothetical protein
MFNTDCKLLRAILLLILFVVIAIPSCNAWWWSYRQQEFTQLLPPKLEIVGSVLTASSEKTGDCFFAVYKLSDKTLSSIKKEGLTFFSDATKSRAYDRNQRNYYHTYKPWQRTPLQYQDRNQSFWAGTNCARDAGFDESFRKKIVLLAFAEGSFYTGHSEGQLVVIPNMGIAVLAGIGD